MKIQIDYVPRPWQAEFHKKMDTKKRAILVLHRRAGKAQPLSAKVLTSSGFIKMGDIKMGQEVLTPKGTTAKVIGIFPQPKQQIYKITLQDGSQTRATGEHLWKVSFANRRRKDGVFNTLYLKEFLERENKRTIRLKSRPLIDSISPELDFGINKNLIIHPYLLGLLIGDGNYSKDSARISTKDKEIIEWIRSNGYKIGYHKDLDYNLPGIISILNKLGLQGQKSNSKIIPQQYLDSNREIRLELLKGLMDTDGYQSDRNYAEYCSVSKQLIEQVAFLCRSLGMNATISNPQKTTFTYKGEKKNGQDKYRLHIRPNQNIFKLKRKLDSQHKYRFDNRKAIIKIEEDGFEVAQCITINDEDHLYITDDFIVTHNSVAIANQLQKDALRIEESKYAYICPTYKQAKAVAWDIFKKYSKDIPNVKYNENELTITYPNKSKIVLLGSDNTQSLRGIGLWGVAMDEYAQQPSNLWSEVILPTLADHDGYAIFLGTPMGKGEFYRIYKNAINDEKWYAALYNIYDTNLFTADQIQTFQKEQSRDEFNQEFLCSFDSSTKGSYYSEEIFKARQEGRIGIFPYNKNLPVHTVWDIGGYTSIGFFQYQDNKLFMIDYLSGDNMGVENYIAQLKNKNYVYGKHFGPWDIIGKNFLMGNRSVAEICYSLGLAFEMAGGKSVIKKQDPVEGIKIAINMFSRLYIDEKKCQFFIDDITLYRREWDTDRGQWKETPLHDYTSHAADMLRYAAQAESFMNNIRNKDWVDYDEEYVKQKYQG